MKKLASVLVILVITLSMIFSSCSGVDKSGGGIGIGVTAGGVAAGTTKISGKVSLSDTVQLSSKTRMKMQAGENYVYGKPGSRSATSVLKPVPGTSLKQTLFGGILDATQLTNAVVDLYDASHPEWLYPVASTKTDANGDYELNKLINSEYNKGATYENDDPIPTGLYTMVAYKVGVGLKPVVSVQAVVNKFDGFTSVDFETVDSDIEPSVQTMFGVFKNTDGTETFGSSGLVRAMNGAIQISFSMPMWRDSLTGISISPTVEGNWSLSADWRTATFYLKSGTTLQPNTVYTVKVNGAETSNPVYNVYTNAIRKSVVGYFLTGPSVDSQSPTAQWKSPSLYDMSSPIDIITPLRIQVNKPLDVNGLYLDASPSVGDRTSVYFLGTEEDSSGNLLYIYEFGLGKSLKLNTTYEMTVKGGKDLAGNPLTTLSASISTKAAASYNAGIDAGADLATQDLQAEIYDVFGKWVRSMNDRNLALFQSLMTGDFYMEYSTVQGLSAEDTNRDGRWSLNEFSKMILNAFPVWSYCGAKIWGEITPQTYITIGVLDPVTNQIDMSMANLEFKLVSSTSVQNQQCSDIAPSETFYMTLKKYNDNSPWVVRRASQGIDNRNMIPSQPSMLKANLYSLSAGQESLIVDGGQLLAIPMPTYGAEFKWDPVPGVQSLVLAVIDSRTNCTGFAAAFPSAVNNVTLNSNPAVTANPMSGWSVDVSALSTNAGNVAVDVTTLFGLGGTNCMDSQQVMGMAPPNFFQQGGEYYWEVIGFKSTDITAITDKSSQTLISDIGYISLLKRFDIAGLYRELTLYVNALGKDITYSGVLQGYDAGGADAVTLTVYTPNTNVTGSLFINGTANRSYDLTFDGAGRAVDLVDRNTGTHFTDMKLSLYRGVNYVWMDDGSGLYKSTRIFTTGGIAPAITFSLVTDDVGTPLASLNGGAWDYFQTNSGATKINIRAQFNPPGTCSPQSTLHYNVYNWKLNAQSSGNVDVDLNGNYDFAGIEIYEGVNWININGSDTCNNYYQRQLGVYTDTGSLWMPLISVVSINDAIKIADYGQMSDWDASNDLDNHVGVNLKFKLCGGVEMPNVDISVWSDGGTSYYSTSNGTLYTDPSKGTANLWLPVYHGMNNISINTWYSSGTCFGGWYNVRVNTNAGIPVVKTAITHIGPTPYNNSGSATVSTCLATITGTAEPGMVTVYWRGYDGLNYYYENSRIVIADSLDNKFVVTVPVVSGNYSYNMVDIYNKNMVSTSVTLYTTGSCSYTYPILSVNPIPPTGASTVTITGTSNKPGQSITAYQNTCSGDFDYYITKAGTSPVGGVYLWSIPNVKVYNGANDFTVSDGYNSYWLSVDATNTSYKKPGTWITSVTDASNPSISYTVPEPTSHCGSVSIDTGTSLAVNITGTTNEPNSRGLYGISKNPWSMMTDPVYFTNGTFTLQNISLYGLPAPDNYLTIANAYGWEVLRADLVSGNPQEPPRYVLITSHTQGGPADPMTVTADIVDPTNSGWIPDYFQAIYMIEGGQAYLFSSDVTEQQTYGYLPITVVTTNLPAGTLARVSYDVPAGATYTPGLEPIEVGVAGVKMSTNEAHVQVVWVNNASGNPEMYYKPGTKTSGLKPRSDKLTSGSLMRDMLRRKALELRK